MKDVFIVSDNIISPLGTTTQQNFSRLLDGASGVQQQNNTTIAAETFYASLFAGTGTWQSSPNAAASKFEQLLIASISNALEGTVIQLSDAKTILIISSTKGNISLVENTPLTPALQTRVAMHTSAALVARHFNCANQPLVVSNACISGLLAILTGKRLIQSGQYDHAVVAGADEISKFVLSGFQSFQAISAGPCKPFDAARNGINLGEGAATIVLSASKNYSAGIAITGGSVSNDANHISGPSRTGDELYQAIAKAMHEAGTTAKDIDFISAHGTATVYNDEMEALAINLAKLQAVPVNSLKGYYGHTLGAAGVIESVICLQSLQQNIILPSRGYTNPGVSKPLNVVSNLLHSPLKTCLKTASGFGGCNAALVFSKA
ncbi:MAG: beta-ketoacyl synthase [Aquabacterium sp.]|nr:beta-ketoacyl synthase [Ferruginibacter sp.]